METEDNWQYKEEINPESLTLTLLSIDSGHFKQRNEQKHGFQHLRMGPTPLKCKPLKL